MTAEDEYVVTYFQDQRKFAVAIGELIATGRPFEFIGRSDPEGHPGLRMSESTDDWMLNRLRELGVNWFAEALDGVRPLKDPSESEAVA